MKILVVTQYFWPENFKINDLVFELKKRGHSITVLTGKPNYPDGYFYDGYSFTRPWKQNWQGVEIKRVPLLPRGKAKGINLFMNYVSFALSGTIFSRHLLRNKEFDCIFVFEISPITVGLPAIWLKRKFKIPIYFWILDLWPDTLYALGVIKSKILKSCVEWFVRFIYKHCDYLLISSKSFEGSLLNFGVLKNKIHYLPNWAEDLFVENSTSVRKVEFEDFFNTICKDKFIIMFAGNLGESQDIESIIKAACHLKEKSNIIWLFVGDGRYKKYVVDEIHRNNLSGTVFLLGKHPVESMPYFFSKAHVMLVSLKSEPVFSLTVPAKIQTYMAGKKPIITMLSGEGSSIVTSAKCGLVCNSGDYIGLASNVVILSEVSNDELVRLGNNGYNYYLENFSKVIIIDRLEQFFMKNANYL